MEKKMKIIVVGGGIGGLTTAVALQQRGFDAQIYEAAPEIRPVGKGIWVPTNAMQVLDRLGIGERIAATGLALDRIEVHDKDQGLLQRIEMEPVRAQFGRSTTSILRSDLQAGLASALADGTLHLDKRCTAVRQNGQEAAVTFEDGTAVSGDLVVGADGIRSVVREAIVPDVPLRYSGQTCYLGVADYVLPEGLLRTVREIWGGRMRFGFSAVKPDKVYWFAPVTAAENGTMPGDVTAVLGDYYADFPAPVTGIIANTAGSEIIRLDLNDIEPIDRWYNGRIVLMGDAAHAMTPNLGQGGAQAIEDAYVLAQVLDKEEGLEAALKQYVAIRQTTAERVATNAWRMGQLAHMEGTWKRRLRNRIFKWTPDWFKQQQVEALYKLNF